MREEDIKNLEIKYLEDNFHKVMDGNVSHDMYLWLCNNKFFSAPASRQYHGAYPGGLYDHSSCVMESLLELTTNNKLIWKNKRSPFIIGMFHDLCKLNLYTASKDINKSSYKYSYEYSNDKNEIYSGHGDKSVMLLAQWYQLTDEEIACIRWHMGAFDEKDNWKYYSEAINKFPNVLWTHTADMIASQIKGK